MSSTVQASGSPAHGLLPDPEPREVRYTLISVDDHLIEPPHTFEGRLPAKLQDRAPKVIESDDGRQMWEFDGRIFNQPGLNAVAGRPKDDWNLEPVRFDQMRPGCYDVDARVRDMDINGVYASVNFPSMIAGFAGRVFSSCSDRELGLATLRAWNDWFFEEWYSAYPARFIPAGITWLDDPVIGAAEIRRNAERGFRAVSLPQRPHKLDLPSIFSGYWDPILEACNETGTVINLHVGSSGGGDYPPDALFMPVSTTMFSQQSLTTCTEWVWSGVAARFPELRVAFSEGGIGWVAMLMDRVDNVIDRSGYGREWPHELRPSELMQRNFWYCTIDDPSTMCTRHRIGIDRICFETDYPHGDSTWPDTQEVIHELFGDLPVDELRMLTHENAANLYRHPLPEVRLP